jgi:hypothetical protein
MALQLLLVFHLLLDAMGGFLHFHPFVSTTTTTTTTTGCHNRGRIATVKWQQHRSQPIELRRLSDNNHHQLDECRREISPFYRRDRNDLEDDDDDDRFPPIIDPDTLEKLLEQRYRARRNHESKLILKQIDSQLWTHFRVKVYDRPPIWTRNPQTMARKNLQNRKWKLQDDHGPHGHPYQQHAAESQIDTKMFCDLTRSEIHSLLSELALWNTQKDSEQYHAIRLELEIHGVNLCDTTLQWSTSTPLPWTSTGIITHERHDDNHHFHNSPPPAPSPPQQKIIPIMVRGKDGDVSIMDLRTQQRIHQLVEMRQAAAAASDEVLAWCIDRELWCTYHHRIVPPPHNQTAGLVIPVKTNNNTTTTTVSTVEQPQQHQEWLPPPLSPPPPPRSSSSSILHPHDERTKFNRFPSQLVMTNDAMDQVDRDLYSSTIPQYRSSRYSIPIPTTATITPNTTAILEHERVLDLIRQRILLREHGRFLEADAIRKELWHTYKVGIHDRLRQYSYGGKFDYCEENDRDNKQQSKNKKKQKKE